MPFQCLDTLRQIVGLRGGFRIRTDQRRLICEAAMADLIERYRRNDDHSDQNVGR